MPEPEELLIDAAHRATTVVGRLWSRYGPRRLDVDGIWLEDHSERLRLLVAALFGKDLSIRIAEPPAPPSFLGRLMRRQPKALVESRALPATDGVHVFLPQRLGPSVGLEPARLFRVLALQQACRAARLVQGGVKPPPAGLRHELFLLSEAMAADRVLATELPGLAADLATIRAAALAGRVPLHLLTSQERAVEMLYRRVLAEPLHCRWIATTPVESLEWAAETAQIVEREPGRYRGLPHDLWWGSMLPVATSGTLSGMPDAADKRGNPPPRTGRMQRRPQVREAAEDEDDGSPGPWMVQTDDPLEHVEDPMGLQRPADRAEADPDELADSLAELPHARLVTTPEPAREVLISDDRPDARTRLASPKLGEARGIRYPEWDYRIPAYNLLGATVRLHDAELGDPCWAERVFARRRVLLCEVKRRFEQLRPRRIHLGRQPDGDELDLDAYVDAFADERAGGATEERLYRATRPARRDIAIAVLVDVSGSTDAWVSEDLRIVDVEKEALLIVCQALEILGDPYTVQAFSGEGPNGVGIRRVKGFEERDQGLIRRRIAALEPDRYTRAGAAIRHVSALLAQRCEWHRLLLLLSDGRPNDIDHYEGRYGVEDMRQAVGEARLQGIHCFCLTVDRQAPGYLPGVFGARRYTVLRHPTHLPTVLVEVLRCLLKS